MAKRTVGASEGDAYRYTKKALMALPNAHSVQSMIEGYLGKEVSWTRNCYSLIRARFFMNGISDILFAPGVARIAFGELHMEDNDEKSIELQQLDQIIQMISANHRDDYSRHLVHNGKPMTYQELNKMFGECVRAKSKELEVFLESKKYKSGHYKIVPLTDFSIAKKYAKFTDKYYGWCHLSNESTFQSYQRGGFVKLYLALKKGYRKLTPDDPGFGESMLGIDIGPRGELVHVNNRWNHAHDHIDEKKGDNKYDAVELSDLLGKPYYKACPPHSREALNKFGLAIKPSEEIINSVTSGEMVDPRDGQHYKTTTIGGITIMSEDFRYVYNPKDKDSIANKLYAAMDLTAHWNLTGYGDFVIPDDITLMLPDTRAGNGYDPIGYNWYAAVGYAPDGWHLPTYEEIHQIMHALGYSSGESETNNRRLLFGSPIRFYDYNIEGTVSGTELFKAVGLCDKKSVGIIHWINDRMATLNRDMYYMAFMVQDDVNNEFLDQIRGRNIDTITRQAHFEMLRYADTIPDEIRFPVENPMVEIPDPPTFNTTIGQDTIFDPNGTECSIRLRECTYYRRLISIINAEKSCRAFMFQTGLTDEAALECRASGSFAPVRYIKD